MLTIVKCNYEKMNALHEMREKNGMSSAFIESISSTLLASAPLNLAHACTWLQTLRRQQLSDPLVWIEAADCTNAVLGWAQGLGIGAANC
jgi:hypothetical protein